MTKATKLPTLALLTTLTLALGACASVSPRDTAPPTNVILFVGDGMGISTQTAIRILAGQLEGKPGEEHILPWEDYPHLALMKTYNTNQQVPDSAGTATAFLTGKKTRAGLLSVNSTVPLGDCPAAKGAELTTIVEQAKSFGHPVGIVTTTRLTHATPAAAYAHTPHRNWESDADIPNKRINAACRDIARQFVDFNKGNGIDFALGGGRQKFLPLAVQDPEYPELTGERQDGRNLITTWQEKYPHGKFVMSAAELAAISDSNPSHVLGLFEPSHMRYAVDRSRDPAGEPSLKDMTEAAIRFLERRSAETKKGYFLIIEAGRIDHAHHAGNAYNALHDGIALADAVALADRMTDDRNTLMIVTADHSHSFTIAGYPTRGNPILGKVVSSEDFRRTNPEYNTEFAHAQDGKPYTTLGYYASPGYKAGERPDLTNHDTTTEHYRQAAAVPTDSGTHGGEDVATFAKGPNAQAFRGVMEQNLIYDVMAEALGLVKP